MARLAFALLALCAVATARMAYQLPAGAEFILRARSVTETFTCEGQPYGYYADPDNNCEIFHVCVPIRNEVGTDIGTEHFSFICGNQTVFDQMTLSCNHEDDAFPCAEVRSLYESSNSEFGVVLDNELPIVEPEIDTTEKVPTQDEP